MERPCFSPVMAVVAAWQVLDGVVVTVLRAFLFSRRTVSSFLLSPASFLACPRRICPTAQLPSSSARVKPLPSSALTSVLGPGPALCPLVDACGFFTLSFAMFFIWVFTGILSSSLLLDFSSFLSKCFFSFYGFSSSRIDRGKRVYPELRR